MKFHIQDIEVPVSIGITKEEQANKQNILINLKFKFDTTRAEDSDNIDDTIDYGKLFEIITAFPNEKTFNLLEKLHKDLLVEIKKNFPDINDLKLSITKLPFQNEKVTISN